MPTAAAPPSGRTHPARARALEASFARLRAWCADPAALATMDKTARVSIGPRIVVLEPWERVQLKEFFDLGDGSDDGVREAVSFSAALMLKGALDIGRRERMPQQPCAEIFAHQAELMLDAAIGMALLRELQGLTEEQVRRGRVEAAKSLSQLRHKLLRAVSEVKEHIAESERERAEALVEDLTDVSAPPSARAYASPAPARQAAAPAEDLLPLDEPVVVGPRPEELVAAPVRRRRPPPSRVSSSAPPTAPGGFPLTTLLVVLLGSSLLACAALDWLPKRFREHPTAFERGDLRSATLIESLVARPPSVYVTLPLARWNALDEKARTGLLQELEVAASSRRYTGVVLRADDGRLLGQWLKYTGARLSTRDEEPQAAAEPSVP